jgi:pimeloyl-ACP methyl ester carboxylesterase
MTKRVKTGTVDANGTKLYYELRGRGPSFLFIPGAEGDAEEYLRVAELLDEEFTVLSYDRRGYSRSPRPVGYIGTTVDRQTDDAAALLGALDLVPAGVWGNSSGAIIGLNLPLRSPEVVRGVMLHEPPLFAGMSAPQEVLTVLRQATANGKVPFMQMLMGDTVYSGLSEGYRARLEADDTWIEHEFDNFEWFRPADEDLAGIQRPVAVLFGTDSPPFFGEAANWLAGRLGTDAQTIPGGHGVHYDHPEEVATAVRDFLVGD